MTILQYFGRPNEVLALTQIISDETRGFARQENRFLDTVSSHKHDKNLEEELLQFDLHIRQ